MLLILLAETNTPGSPTFTLPAARIAQHYGLSTSTVKRGLDELREHGLLDERWQRVPAPRSATGWTYKVHYWLNSPFSTKYREAARKADGAEIAAKTKAIAESKSGKQT
jgi:DeoR/GlpR family transcriptional regulator of sugar metabolism